MGALLAGGLEREDQGLLGCRSWAADGVGVLGFRAWDFGSSFVTGVTLYATLSILNHTLSVEVY